MSNLATRLIDARNGANLTQQELADRVPCSQSTIGNLESGLRESPKFIIAIARALGVTAEWLMDGVGPKLPNFELSQKELFLVQSYRDASPAGMQLIELACIGARKPELG